jgi:peptide/nickel transport system permease protein
LESDEKTIKSGILSGTIIGFWKQFKQYRPGYIGLIVMVLSIVIAVIAPYIIPYDPTNLGEDLISPPSLKHFAGTDHFGRDEFSRVLIGLRTSLLVGIGAAGLSTIIGVVLGAIPGYFGGRIDDVFSRFFEIFMMIPTFFLVLLAVSFFGSNIYLIMLIIGLTSWPGTARIMRSQVMTLKTLEFVESSIAIGGGDFYTLFRHIVPNGLYPVITSGALRIGGAMITEAGLSFLGLGDPSAISLGREIRTGARFLGVAPWIVAFPGLVLFILVLAFNMIGDGINFTFNPKLRER